MGAAKESSRKKSIIDWSDESGVEIEFDRIRRFKPFEHGSVVFGSLFGDEGKGKKVDELAESYKSKGLKVLSIRGQGSGNAGHTVVVDGVKYDFHYLTSAGLSADIMLLGPGMLVDPIRVLKEAEKLPEEKRKIIMVAERATIVTDVDRAMDSWCENQRFASGQKVIGTTKSGVGPGAGNRGYRVHITFADALQCKNAQELRTLALKNPILPDEVREILTREYSIELWEAINKLNIVDSNVVIANCRNEGNWAILLEVSQAIGLDPLFGNGGHFTTSTPCTDIGGAAGAGLTMKDFPDGCTMMLKAYASKVGGGPFITKFSDDEKHIDKFIDDMVGEHGVTTGRKRELGWFDGPAVRYAIELTGAKICVNCMDVIAELPKITDHIKVCFAYQNKWTGEVTYDWPYNLYDYRPLYASMSFVGLSKEEIIKRYIVMIEAVMGQTISGFGVGPSRKDYRKRIEAI